MIGLDTNVLVRYITRDDPEQYRAAKAFLESKCTQEEPGYVNVVVLCELVWVLTGAYEADRKDVVRILNQLLRTRQLHIANRDAVRAALRTCLADCLRPMTSWISCRKTSALGI